MRKKNKKTFSARERRTVLALTGRGVKIWTVVIVMIAGWMFVLGVFVGRGTTPVKFDIDSMQRDLATLRENKAARKKEEKAVPFKEADAVPTLEFHRKLTDSRPETAFKEDLRRIEKQPDPPPVPPPAQAAANLPKPLETIAAETGPETRATAVTPPDSQKPPASAGTGGWTIQVAAVKDAGDADRMVETLRKKGYDAYRVKGSHAPDNTWHRVRVGAFADREQADAALGRLTGDKFKGFVVKR